MNKRINDLRQRLLRAKASAARKRCPTGDTGAELAQQLQPQADEMQEDANAAQPSLRASRPQS